MKRTKSYVAAILAISLQLAGAVQPAPVLAQRGTWGDDRGLEETIWAIQRARVVTRILYVTAHPDDEPFPLLTYLARGLNADVALLAITRGEGGQNAVGPEQGAGLGMLRTDELLAATRAYGIRLFFTRAPDFGYSKTSDETIQIWGREAYDDVVQVIRTFRPHIVINNWGGVRTGHGNHIAAGLITPKAVESAADPAYITFKVDRGLDPWKVDLLLQPARGNAAGAVTLPSDDISPLWGRSYTEIGRDGFANHRTQGILGFLAPPFVRRSAPVVRVDGGALDAAKLAEPLISLAERYPKQAEQLRALLEECDKHLAAAETAARQLDWPAAVRALAKAAALFAPPQQRIPPFDPSLEWQQIRWEVSRISGRIQNALELAAGYQLAVTADRNLVTPGGKFGVRVEWRSRPGIGIEAAKPQLLVPKTWTVTEEQSEGALARFTVTLPADAKPAAAPDSWMLPWLPALLGAWQQLKFEGVTVMASAAAMAAQTSSTSVRAAPVLLVPAASVALQPQRVFLRTGQVVPKIEILARVHYFGSEPTKLAVGIEAPKGWKVSAEQAAEFTEEGDRLLKFSVTPPGAGAPLAKSSPGSLAVGAYDLKAYAKRGNEVFAASLEPLPSLPTRMISSPATAQVRVLDLNVPAGLRVGYIAAENDPIPYVLGQLGMRVEMLDEVALAFGDLSKFDAICIGIRAYELRNDLTRANARLLDYARAGGTLVVQYQRQTPWNQINPAPYPATVGQQTIRTTDENSPVRLVVPKHPVLNFPNVIQPDDWVGWIQERGLYYWGQWDRQYQPILALRDPGEEETLGSLLYARVGKGVYIYTGLVFFRELPTGVPGAVRLFVNLLSQGKAPAQTPASPAKTKSEK